MIETAWTLWDWCQLKAIMLIGPICTPDTFRLLKNHDQLFERGGPWKRTVWNLDNTKHGGPIETRHQVICLLQPETANHFDLPGMTVNRPIGMNEVLTPNANQGMLRKRLQFMKATNREVSETAGDQHSSRVIKRVKLKTEAQPTHGYPVYDPRAPAPSIGQSNPSELEDFFQGTFGIWTEPYKPGISTCRPVQQEELMVVLIGLSQQKSMALMTVKWDSALRRLRVAPGKEGMVTLFDSLLQAEVEANNIAVSPYTSPGMIPTLQTTVTMNEATTYPLPTADDWREATAADHDLALIMRVMADGSTLTKTVRQRLL
jgi:hypothetical protein